LKEKIPLSRLKKNLSLPEESTPGLMGGKTDFGLRDGKEKKKTERIFLLESGPKRK